MVRTFFHISLEDKENLIRKKILKDLKKEIEIIENVPEAPYYKGNSGKIYDYITFSLFFDEKESFTEISTLVKNMILGYTLNNKSPTKILFRLLPTLDRGTNNSYVFTTRFANVPIEEL